MALHTAEIVPTDQSAPVHIVATEDKGYCHAQIRNHYFRINGRKYHAGFCKNGRIVFQGPIVGGWFGFLNEAATVIAKYREAETITDANIGDLVQGPEGTVYRIALDPQAYPTNNRDGRYLGLLKIIG